MECLNRLQLRGHIGSARVSQLSEHQIAHFTVATNRAFKDKDGNVVIETTWHQVEAWTSRDVPATVFERLKKGLSVFVEGRLINQRYIASDGTERTMFTLRATKIEILGEEMLSPELN